MFFACKELPPLRSIYSEYISTQNLNETSIQRRQKLLADDLHLYEVNQRSGKKYSNSAAMYSCSWYVHVHYWLLIALTAFSRKLFPLLRVTVPGQQI